MNTEIADNRASSGAWVFYDGNCALCTGWVRRFESSLRRRHYRIAPLQTPWARDCLGLPEQESFKEMAVLTEDGRILGGADAIVHVARGIWWGFPLFVISRFPGMMPLLRAAYRRLAVRRMCLNGACKTTGHGSAGDCLPLLLLPVATLLFRTQLSSWVFMWALVAALFFGCKWLTWRLARRGGLELGRFRSLAYFVAWIGMDPRALTKVKAAPGPSRRDWLAATLKLGLGIVLIVMAVPAVAGRNPLAAGWIGMVGIVLCLHFGLFELGALAWRKAGFCVEPLMARPLGAASLGEFWGRRWNTAFHQLAHELVFRPMRRRSDIAAATLATFAVSGLVHELVISLPAGGGWGLPTLYFLVQGSGLLFERATWFRSVVARRKWVARIFTMAIVVGPVFYLFHPDFIRNVILPMLQHFGAT